MTDRNKELPTIQLRPSEQVAKVRYIKSPEEVGLMLDRTNQLAVFTSRSAPSVGPPGPQGPPGEDKNSWYDCVIAAVTEEITPITVGGPKFTWRSPFPISMNTPDYPGYIRCHVTDAPVGADLIIDVHMNGVSMLSSLIHIDDGTKTSVGSASPAVLSTTYIPDDAEFQVYVTQVGTVFAGAGLKVSITGIKTD